MLFISNNLISIDIFLANLYGIKRDTYLVFRKKELFSMRGGYR